MTRDSLRLMLDSLHARNSVLAREEYDNHLRIAMIQSILRFDKVEPEKQKPEVTIESRCFIPAYPESPLPEKEKE